ncbi:Regulator of competence-specific genes [uncultured Blautia sp.]|nr:TfoX/Sxy family protein [uncultured Blautia sp.]SCJ14212.1 Regulator of competence-specific genes [uncultured Blautia sp.]
MASSKEYLQFILEQLSDLEEINYRAMMGEYIIYYRDRIAGGIYDNRLLVKPTKSAISYMATKRKAIVPSIRFEEFFDRHFSWRWMMT